MPSEPTLSSEGHSAKDLSSTGAHFRRRLGIDTLRDLEISAWTAFTPNCILLVKWRGVVLACDAAGVKIIPEQMGSGAESFRRLVESLGLPKLAYWQDCGICLRRMACRRCDSHPRGDILINWTWSHHQFEIELFSAGRPTNFVDLIVRGFGRRSKLRADSNVGPYPSGPITREQFFFKARQTRRPTVCPE